MTEIPQSKWPDAWYEDQGVELIDTAHAIFLHLGRPALCLFSRKSKTLTSPMAVGHTGEIYQVIDCEVVGFFQKKVVLKLRNREGLLQQLKVPYSDLSQDFANQAPSFFKWVKAIAPLSERMPLPAYMFARNINLGGNADEHRRA